MPAWLFLLGRLGQTSVPFPHPGTPLSAANKKKAEQISVSEVGGTRVCILRSWEGVKEEAPAPFCVSGSMQNEVPQGHTWAPNESTLF